MIQALREQYELTRRTRKIVFDFLRSEVGEGTRSLVAAFDGKSIDDLLVHTAFCYYNWLACFAMEKPLLPGRRLDGLTEISAFYDLVDETMATFLQTFGDRMDTPISGTHDAMGQLTATPLAVFTHVMTHEFHHKGQIMSMCRLLGYPPPDTDVSNFFQGA